MEPEPTMEQLNDEKVVTEKLDEACDMDTETVGISATLLPISAHSTNESTDLPLVLSSLHAKPLNVSCFDTRQPDHDLNSSSEDSPRTPKDALFDPFASDPDRLLPAPFCFKFRTSACILSSSLKIKDTEQCESEAARISENRMVEAVYEELLGAIRSKQAEEYSLSDDGCMTPTSINLLNDVAETCPDAPARSGENLKNARKVSSKKKLDFINTTGLCRKLEF